jgi:sterol desaturase/sphingolipid hydroxylase (fatty acid hydroxylase superfamily)
MIFGILIFLTQCLFYIQPFIDRTSLLIYARSWFDSDRTFYIWMMLGVNLVTRLIVDIFYMILYRVQPRSLEKYRTNRTWLWETDKQYNSKIFYTTSHFILINILLVIPLITLTFDENRDHNRIDPYLVPEWYVSFGQIMIGLIMYDFMFFVIHRTLHMKSFYWIHKMHHEYNNPVIWSDAHTSLLEVIFVAIIPNIIIGIFIQMHIYTQLMFTIVSISLGISQHSNYDLPYSPFYLIPFCDTYKGHILHHNYTSCNYAPYWSFWDRILNSYRS